MPLAKDHSLKELAKNTDGCVGADISAVWREVAISAMRRYLPQIDLESKEIAPELLDQIEIIEEDFNNALKEVKPSV